MTSNSNLDPDNWDDFRTQAHQALDDAINHMQNRNNDPVWQPVPDDVRASLKSNLPLKGTPDDVLQDQMRETFLPYNVGNTHARFFGWVHGAGTPEGVIPEIYASAMNANLGGRDHVANEVEKQVIDWSRQMFSFPQGTAGLVVSGTSMASLIALKSAREKHGGLGLRATGVGGQKKPLVGYTSSETHSCIARTFDILGLGRDALRVIPTDADFRIDLDALRTAITRDISDGYQPFCLIGTAGSVNTGAIDPLEKLADIAQEFDLWLHIDGAFGALVILSDELKPRLKGIERAQSLAFDFHKWMHVNYDAGCVLVRDGEDQRAAFSERPDYLQAAHAGLAAGNPWFCEYGPELSRGFRALKVWYQISRFGTERLGAHIAKNCAHTAVFCARIKVMPDLELLAGTGLNITCLRYNPGGLDEAALDDLNENLTIELQLRGIAAPSTTQVGGRLAIRVNITNHRTEMADLEILLEQILLIGVELTD